MECNGGVLLSKPETCSFTQYRMEIMNGMEWSMIFFSIKLVIIFFFFLKSGKKLGSEILIVVCTVILHLELVYVLPVFSLYKQFSTIINLEKITALHFLLIQKFEKWYSNL